MYLLLFYLLLNNFYLYLLGIFNVILTALWLEKDLKILRLLISCTIFISLIRVWSISFSVRPSGDCYVHFFLSFLFMNALAIFNLLRWANSIGLSPFWFLFPKPNCPIQLLLSQFCPILAFQPPVIKL